MSLDLLASLFETPPVAIDETKHIIGFFIFIALIIGLLVIIFALAKYIERARWFIDRSFHFALWAAAWCCAVLLLRSAFGVTWENLVYVAVGPIVLILVSLFALVLLQIPVAWTNAIMDVANRFKRRD